MKVVHGIILGAVIGAVCSGIVTAEIVKASLVQSYSDNPHGCGRIFPSYSVALDGLPRPASAARQEDEASGYGTKLGGEPDWIQGVSIPICPLCKHPMLFVAQIDSIAMIDKHAPQGRDAKTGKLLEPFMFGDAGMVYVFTCIECGEVAGVGQCY